MKKGDVQERGDYTETALKEAAWYSPGDLWLRFLTTIGFRELYIN